MIIEIVSRSGGMEDAPGSEPGEGIPRRGSNPLFGIFLLCEPGSQNYGL